MNDHQIDTHYRGNVLDLCSHNMLYVQILYSHAHTVHMCVDCAAGELERPTNVHINMFTDCICSVTLTSSNFIISVHGRLHSCTWFWHIMHGMHVQSCGIVAEVDQSIHLGWNCLRRSMHLGWNCMLEPITAIILVYFCRLVKSQEMLKKQEQEVSILACSLRNTNKMYSSS